MEVKLHIRQLKANAKRRPEGYVEFVLTRGKITGDFVVLDEAALNELYEKFPNPLGESAMVTPPTAAQMSANFAAAMTNWAKGGFKTVEKKVFEERLAICSECTYWDATARAGFGKCKICGCAKAKLWLATSQCPLQPPKW